MNFKDFKDKINSISSDFDLSEIKIDTEARIFNLHLVDVESINIINLDIDFKNNYVILYPNYKNTDLNITKS